MSSARSMELKRDLAWRRLMWLAIIVCAGWFLAIAYHHVAGAILGRSYPYDTFLFLPADRYHDLLNSWAQAKGGNPYYTGGTLAVATYFPFVYLTLALGRACTAPWVVLAYLALTFGGALWVCSAWLRAQREAWRDDGRWPAVVIFAALLMLASYPMLFAVDRGNLDPLIMTLLVGSLALAARGRFNAGALLVAVAAASKGYALVWFVWWLKRRRFSALALGLAATAALVVLPGLAFDGGIPATLAGFAHGMAQFHHKYVVGYNSAVYSADWLNGARLLARYLGFEPNMETMLAVYRPLALIGAGALTLYALLAASEPWRELLAAALIMVTFPNIANDYKLVLLLPAILAWIAAPSENGWRDRVFCLCAGLLLVPKHFAFLHLPGRPSISCLVSPLLLSGLTATLWPTSEEARRLIASWDSVRGRALLAARQAGRVFAPSPRKKP